MMNVQKSPMAKTIQEVFLENIGVKSIQDINQWYIKSKRGEYAINSMQDAIDFIMKYHDKKVVICGDYDCDGVTATAILYRTLTRLRFNDVSYMIPDRSEGYGLNVRMVEEIAATSKNCDDVCLLTVDNGIMAHEPIELAKNFGMGVVILDHHLGKEEEDGSIDVPCADVIVNPSALKDTAVFDGYCGAGLSYRFASAILGEDVCKELLTLATLATFADVMPLREENYVIAREGLKLLNKRITVEGIIALIEESGIEHIDEQTVLFKLAPILNAPGRIKPNGAMQAVELLITDSRMQADMSAKELVSINEERKKLVEKGVGTLQRQIEGVDNDIIIEYIPDTNQGIVGILAGQITETTKRPSIVFTDNQHNPSILVGSARSVDGLHIKNTLDEVAALLVSYGGHEGAAGVSVEKANFKEFKEKVQKLVKEKHLTFSEPEISYYDLEIPCIEVENSIKELNRYAPYGQGNPRIRFKITDYNVEAFAGVYKRVIAKGGVRLSSKNHITAIGFEMADKMSGCERPSKMNLYGELALNYFRGKSTPQIEFYDFDIIEEHERINLEDL